MIIRKIQASQPDGFWLVTGAAALWGTTGVVTQLIYNIDSTTTLFVNLSRLVIATPVILIACWQVCGRGMFSIPRRDLLIMALSGLLMAISQAAYFAAVPAAGISIATLLTVCLAPLVVTVLALILKLETLTQRLIFALVCALIGSALLVSGGAHQSDGTPFDMPLGSLLAFVSAVTYAGVVICGRFVAERYNPLQITAVNFSIATLVMIAINAVSGFAPLHTVQGWLLVVYLGFVPTALAYWLLQTGLRSVSATAASILTMSEPLVAALLAWAIFGETLSLLGIVGAGILAVSMFFLSEKSSRANERKPHARVHDS
ncbi:MAG: EamA family transporter [Burkholderiales bacterium]|nr:EamA family transporter [Anaerolineae bacterium]